LAGHLGFQNRIQLSANMEAHSWFARNHAGFPRQVPRCCTAVPCHRI